MRTAQDRRYDQELASFQEQGYVILRNVLGPRELEALQEESMAQIDAGPDREPQGHFKSAPGADGEPRFFRIESTVTKVLRSDAVLHAMANPSILELTSRILPDGFVIWADALLWKGADGGPGVAMHSAHAWNVPHTHENMVVDLYLDESNPSTGCLKVLPGSHKMTPDESREALKAGYDVPGLIDVEMQPGDVLFHSEWMIHGSLPTPPLGKTSRRIVYFAVQDPAARVTDATTPEERRLLAAQMRRLQVAMEHRRTAYGEEPADVDVVPPGWEADVAAITEEEALSAPSAAC